jgi:ParB family chromosome partitioning protein
MNKRSDTIRSLFAATPAAALSADNAQAVLPRVASGSIRSLQNTFSDVERENDDLREQLASRRAILELDPNLVEASPVKDRFEDQDGASFEALKASILASGQEVPVLVREHSARPGYFQAAYGHRRIRATRELGIQVKAIVRPMSDEELAIAQGVENSAREDLTFIERAVFAMRLESAGHARGVVQKALAVDRAEASKLVSVGRAVPLEIIDAIGRAPKVGRGRWQALTEAIQAPAAVKRSLDAISSEGFEAQNSDSRFLSVLNAATKKSGADGTRNTVRTIKAATGEDLAVVTHSNKQIRLTFDQQDHAEFVEFVESKLAELFDAYSLLRSAGDRRRA